MDPVISIVLADSVSEWCRNRERSFDVYVAGMWLAVFDIASAR
jgi:hypothetical protein